MSLRLIFEGACHNLNLDVVSLLRASCIHRDRTTVMAHRTASAHTRRELEPSNQRSINLDEAAMTHEKFCIADKI